MSGSAKMLYRKWCKEKAVDKIKKMVNTTTFKNSMRDGFEEIFITGFLYEI